MTGTVTARTRPEWRNWAGNQHAVAVEVVRPGSTDEVAAVLRAARAANRTVKPVGTGHSFTGAAATTGVRLELDRLRGIVGIDRDARTVRVLGGTPLHRLNAELAALGLALPNLGDIDVQTVTGALATGTHGTGARYGCLSTFVEELEIVTGDGAVQRCSARRNPELFQAARVGVGALGVVTEVTLRCVDAFILYAEERPERLDAVLSTMEERVAGNDHFEFYWMPYTDRTLTKSNNRVPLDDRSRGRLATWFNDDFLENTVIGAVCRMCRAAPRLTPTLLRATAAAFSARRYTERSDLVFTSPRRVRFVEMEYGLPRDALPEALVGLRRLLATIPVKVALPVEVRFTAGDDIWLSHGYGRENAYVAIHQFQGMPFEPYLRAFEAVCVDLGGRPHWGKMHYRGADSLRPAYPRFDDFLAVRDRVDPDRLMANEYTDQIFGA